MSRGPKRPRGGGRSHGIAHTARTLAASVVARVLDDGAWAGPALDAALASSALDGRDRGLCTELVYGTLRWQGALAESLRRASNKPNKKLDKKLNPHLLVAAYQLQHLEGRIPPSAAVSSAVDAVRAVRPGLAGLANALLRNLGSPLHEQLGPDAPLDDVARAFGIPEPLAAAVAGDLDGEDRIAALAALCARPSLGVTALGEPDRVRADLEGAGAEVQAHPFVPSAFLASGAGRVADIDGFDLGRWLVQDPGSLVIAKLCAPSPGMRVLDMCAAPGGKAVVLARALGVDGEVLALDKDPARAARVEENARRCRANIEVRVADATSAELPAGGFDVVLLDAPCSALGTTRRRPDVRWAKRDDDAALHALQAELLAAAARAVKPGGALVYAVCTPMPDEGPRQVEAFLAANADFRPALARDVLEWLPAHAQDADGFVRLATWRHQCDGFFGARLVRAR